MCKVPSSANKSRRQYLMYRGKSYSLAIRRRGVPTSDIAVLCESGSYSAATKSPVILVYTNECSSKGSPVILVSKLHSQECVE